MTLVLPQLAEQLQVNAAYISEALEHDDVAKQHLADVCQAIEELMSADNSVTHDRNVIEICQVVKVAVMELKDALDTTGFSEAILNMQSSRMHALGKSIFSAILDMSDKMVYVEYMNFIAELCISADEMEAGNSAFSQASAIADLCSIGDTDFWDIDDEYDPNSTYELYYSIPRTLAYIPYDFVAQVELPREVRMQNIENQLKRHSSVAEMNELNRKASRKLSDEQTKRCATFNATCKYQPIDLEDWCEHPHQHYYDSGDNKCFDLEELVLHIENGLGAIKNGNPYPQYPNDPYDRRRFGLDELQDIYESSVTAGLALFNIAPKFSNMMSWVYSLRKGGDEWKRFDRKAFSGEELYDIIAVMYGKSRESVDDNIFRSL